MNAQEAATHDPLFEYVGGAARFRGLAVEVEVVETGGRSFRLAGLKDAADLLDHAEFARAFVEEDRAPYGLELWPAAPMLAACILAGEEGAGRTALDLGCGLGLVSMAATVRGWRVTAADYDPIALRFAEHNARLNGIAPHRYEVLNWHRPPSDVRYDRIFGADILYQRSDHTSIARCVAALLAPGGTAYLADPNRSVADGFAATGRDCGLEVSLEPVSAAFRSRPVVSGRVFRLQIETRR